MVKCEHFVDMSDRDQAKLLQIIRLTFPRRGCDSEYLMLHFLYSVHAIITYRRFGSIIGFMCLTDVDRDECADHGNFTQYIDKGLAVENWDLCTNITNVCVLPSLQRRGIGTKLMQVYLKMLPCDSELFLHVDVHSKDPDQGPHNDLVRWYRGLGFSIQYTDDEETCMYLKKRA